MNRNWLYSRIEMKLQGLLVFERLALPLNVLNYWTVQALHNHWVRPGGNLVRKDAIIDSSGDWSQTWWTLHNHCVPPRRRFSPQRCHEKLRRGILPQNGYGCGELEAPDGELGSESLSAGELHGDQLKSFSVNQCGYLGDLLTRTKLGITSVEYYESQKSTRCRFRV